MEPHRRRLSRRRGAGCGRGAVLLTAAKLLTSGRAIGVDIWRADQTDNSSDNTLRNAAIEGVADRVVAVRP